VGLSLGINAVMVTSGSADGTVLLSRVVMLVNVTLASLIVLLHSYRDFRLGGARVPEARGDAAEAPPAERARPDHETARDQEPLGAAGR